MISDHLIQMKYYGITDMLIKLAHQLVSEARKKCFVSVQLRFNPAAITLFYLESITTVSAYLHLYYKYHVAF